ncbi:CatB-related O-acetyltransferase [Sphingobacterium daejeonense]|uniref:CatB-related O-acetyltransferase n=1 Tax=Sphingobacterium daejeonense TaxID=371142 RepID=A0ABW3RMP5_9SPHI
MKLIKPLFFLIKNFLRIPIDFIKKNKIHKTTRISSNTKLVKCLIGKYCYIANNVNMVNATIGNYVSIAPGVQIGGMEHSYWWYSTSTFLSDQNISNQQTIIEDDVWIGAGSIIKQGVRIGRGAVIGAMSFVNKDVPDYTITFGVPAKTFKDRFNEELKLKVINSKFWIHKPIKAREILNKL